MGHWVLCCFLRFSPTASCWSALGSVLEDLPFPNKLTWWPCLVWWYKYHLNSYRILVPCIWPRPPLRKSSRIPTCAVISGGHLRFSTFKTQCLTSISPAFSHPDKWPLHLPSCLGPKPGAINDILHFLTSYFQSFSKPHWLLSKYIPIGPPLSLPFLHFFLL